MKLKMQPWMKSFEQLPNKGPGVKGCEAFTLMELMVVVGIIAIVVNLSTPILNIFKINAARSEATVNLNGIHALQAPYHASNGHYGSIKRQGPIEIVGLSPQSCISSDAAVTLDIGFRVKGNPCQLRYYYYTTIGSDRLVSSAIGDFTKYSAVAQSMDTGYIKTGVGFSFSRTRCLGGYYIDSLVINQDKRIGHSNELNPSYNPLWSDARVRCQ